MEFKRKKIGSKWEYRGEDEDFYFKATFKNDFWTVVCTHKTMDITYTSSWSEKIPTYNDMKAWCDAFTPEKFPCIGKDSTTGG